MKRKTMKKAGAAVLTMAMILSMGAMGLSVNAAAGDAKTVQIKNPSATTVTGAKFYKVASQSATTGEWSWEGNFTNNQKFETLKKVSAEDLNALANSLKARAAAAQEVSATKQDGYTGGVQYQLNITGKGYYLVVPTVADNSVAVQPSLVEIDSTGDAYTTLNTKANPLPLNKYIAATTNGETDRNDGKSKTSTGILNSKVTYSIESVLPEYDVSADPAKIQPYILTDDPSDGIAIDVSTVKVSVDGTDVTSNAKIAVARKDDGFTVTVAGDFIKPAATASAANYEGKNIVVTFDATIDADAVYGADSVTDADLHNSLTGNPNTVKLTWGNNYVTGAYAYPSDHTPTPDEPEVPTTPQVEKKDSVTTYIGKVTLKKQNGEKAALANAKFTLTGTNYNEKSFTTNGNGQIDFGYLPAGDYTLVETQAPSGYKTIGQSYTFSVATREAGSNNSQFSTYEVTAGNVAGVVEVALTNEGAVAELTVTDPPADTLPATGGIGTYVFTFGGAAIVLMAGVLFIVYMKKRKVEE